MRAAPDDKPWPRIEFPDPPGRPATGLFASESATNDRIRQRAQQSEEAATQARTAEGGV